MRTAPASRSRPTPLPRPCWVRSGRRSCSTSPEWYRTCTNVCPPWRHPHCVHLNHLDGRLPPEPAQPNRRRRLRRCRRKGVGGLRHGERIGRSLVAGPTPAGCVPRAAATAPASAGDCGMAPASLSGAPHPKEDRLFSREPPAAQGMTCRFSMYAGFSPTLR